MNIEKIIIERVITKISPKEEIDFIKGCKELTNKQKLEAINTVLDAMS